MNSPFSLRADGAYLTIRARAGSNKPRAPKLVDIGEGKHAIEVTVSAPPEDGRANKAICEQLAKLIGLNKNKISVKAGQSGRIKTIFIEESPETLGPALEKWVSPLS